MTKLLVLFVLGLCPCGPDCRCGPVCCCADATPDPIVIAHCPAGATLTWSGQRTRQAGSTRYFRVPAGTYTVRCSLGDWSEVRRVVVGKRRAVLTFVAWAPAYAPVNYTVNWSGFSFGGNSC